MYAKTADFTTATPPAAIVRPAVSLASSGLTLTTLGTQTAGRSAFLRERGVDNDRTRERGLDDAS